MSKPQVPAARNTLQILSLLSAIDVPVSAARIRSELGLPRSTTYHLLAELVDAGFVVHLPEHQTYGLGLAAYAMASAYTTQQPLVRMVTSDLEKAADIVGGSGHLSRLAGSEIVYLQEVRSARAVSLVTEVGVRLPALRTASGRSMVAHLPDSEVRATFSVSGESGTLRKMREDLALIRQQGWAQEIEEVSRGQTSVGVAILDHLNRPAAALAVTYPARGVDNARRDKALAVLHKAARRVAHKMYRAT